MTCLLAGHSACDGRVQDHHVLERRHLKRQFPRGAVEITCPACGGGKRSRGCKVCVRARVLVPVRKPPDPEVRDLPHYTVAKLIDDHRNLVGLCVRHHQLLHGRRIEVAATDAALEFAVWCGMAWRVEARHG